MGDPDTPITKEKKRKWKLVTTLTAILASLAIASPWDLYWNCGSNKCIELSLRV